MSENVKRSRKLSEDEETHTSERIEKKLKQDENPTHNYPYGNVFKIRRSCFASDEIFKNFGNLYPRDKIPANAILVELSPYKDEKVTENKKYSGA